MQEVNVEGNLITVKEDVEIGAHQTVLSTAKFGLKFPSGADKVFGEKLNAVNKDQSLKLTGKKRIVAVQDFILGRMKKVKDEVLEKDDFWNSFIAFKKVIFPDEK